MAFAAGKENQAEPDAAIDAYKKVLRRFPDFKPAIKRLAVLYAGEQANHPDALDLAMKARDAYPFDPEVAEALGIIDYRQGEFTKAVSLLKESAKARGQDGEVQYYLGMALRQVGQQTAGQQALRRALDLNLKPELAALARRALADAK
jgi:Flp pilus assembly protein TadD